MSGYTDDPRDYDRDRDRDGDRRGDDPERVAAARSALAAPATFVILNGLFGIVLAALMSIPFVFQPEMMFDFWRKMLANQPPGQQRKEQEDNLDKLEQQWQQNRVQNQLSSAFQLGLFGLANLMAVVGGLAMRSLGNYGLGMTGAVVSLLPGLTGCCCTGMPFGIWALMVLVRQDVKDGFAAKKRLAANPDGY